MFTNVKINKQTPHLKETWETSGENPDTHVTQHTLLTPIEKNIPCIFDRR